MGNYTVTIKELIERNFHFALDNYPVFDESYRQQLNQKILDHYYYREIGQETPDRFNHYLSRTMSEIMPYYNQLYMSELIKYDPLASEYFTQKIAEEKTQDKIAKLTDKRKQNDTTGDVITTNIDRKNKTDTADEIAELVIGNYNKSGTGKTDTVADTTVTNDLQTHVTLDNSATGSVKTSGSKSSIFSDIPQSGINTTRIIAPDGTITETTNGYATTSTNESMTENSNTTNREESDSNTTNTGTINTEQTSTDNNTWGENGDDNRNKTGTTKGVVDDVENVKEDTQRNTLFNSNLTNARQEKANMQEVNSVDTNAKGRRGFSPAALIKEYRSTFLNIDMMIIEELTNLFMGVY